MDAQEFEHLKFKRNRFTPGLLDQLRTAAQSVNIDGEHVVLHHLYVERRVTPLNLYLEEARGPTAEAAVLDYGNAIKDLAHMNIFPGDLLLKNFGVTRHGRVVFYDYDELSLLTMCNFRAMPRAKTYEEELSAEPWFAVESHDVFPEEFEPFLLSGDKVRRHFDGHRDLLTAQYWNEVKERVGRGQIADVFPYPDAARFARRFASAG